MHEQQLTYTCVYIYIQHHSVLKHLGHAQDRQEKCWRTSVRQASVCGSACRLLTRQLSALQVTMTAQSHHVQADELVPIQDLSPGIQREWSHWAYSKRVVYVTVDFSSDQFPVGEDEGWLITCDFNL